MRLKSLLFALLAVCATCVRANTVDVLRVISATSNTPVYIRLDALPSIKCLDEGIRISTTDKAYTFEFTTNPSIAFVQVDESDLSSLISILQDNITTSKDVRIYTIDGRQVATESMTTGTYIVKTPSQTFKFHKQ